ncbi:MAG: secretin N-terminal domain-containing protein, partial [Planctomycetota bacterium]|jgi:type II secretory pathway component GspD/PulD (secretin)
VDLPEKLPITDFLDFVGKNLKLDFLYDPAQVKGDVTLRINGELRGPIKVKELYAMMESVLQFYGFAMTRKGNLVTVRPTADAALIDPPLVRAEGDKVEAGDVVITRVFELEHIDPASAQNLLTGMKLGLTVTPISGTGTLIVTDYAYRMARVEELIKMVDKPGEPKEFRYRPLKYTMAQTLAPKIKTLVEQLGEIAITVVKPETPPQQPPGRRPSRPSRRPPPKKPTPAPKQPPAAAQPTVYLDFDERTNRILMIGLKSELDIVEELIDSLDVVQQDLRSLRLYEIQNVDAEEVRIKLGELGIITGERTDLRRTRRGADRTGVPSRTRQPARPGTQAPPARTVTGAATEEPLVEEPQVVIIETINSLLVNATPEQHAQIAMIIGYVDSVPEQKDIPYVVYPLENQDPEELANVLNQLIQETTTRQEKDAKIVTTTKTTEEDIIIIPDPKTYSLIVYASKRNQQWIRALVEQLDEYRAQVLLDVTLVEILKSDEFELDVDLISKFPKLEAGETMDFLNALLEPFPAKRIKEATSFSGVGDAFFADSHVQLLLHAVQRKGYGRILARPKLLVNDNEEGVIKDERTTTIVTVKTQVIPGTAATASVAAPSVEFQPYEEGITLTITPHISKGDQLQLTIALIRTNFEEQDDYTITVPGAGADGGGGTLSGPTPPDLLTTDVSTVVTVPDNHTIILGGLERVNQTKGGTKVPLLGDIPLIGGLFRSTRNKDDQSRLYVFVKPHIVRPGEPLDGTSRIEVVSKKSRLKFESYEDEMQKYEDWPGIKPKPMSPLRALEVD